MREDRKNQKGITLIALIVTIIVLIILAAVGISMLLGENGITEKARWSEFVTEFRKLQEEDDLIMTEKQINEYGKGPKSREKFSFQSLFTNISYASDSTGYINTIHPIIRSEEGRVDINRVATSLRTTIKTLEHLTSSQIKKEKYVQLYKVDLSLLETKKTKREYVINIISGKLYSLDQVPYQGLIYHTPDLGVKSGEESDYMIHYLLGEGEGEETQNIPNGSPTITLKTEEEIISKPAGKILLHWELHEEDDEEDEEATGNDENGTENATRTTYKGGVKINLSEEGLIEQDIYLEAVWQDGVTLNANGGTIIEEGKEIKTKTIAVIKGEKYGTKLETPIRTGYTFNGWYTEENGGTKMTSEDEYLAEGLPGKTLYAHWVDDIKPEEFTISVSDLTSEGFTMNLSREDDYGSGVKEVKYYVNDTLDTVNGNNQAEKTVTGLTKDMTKYVWAEITDDAGNTRRSTNYVKVWTGHTHSTEDGVCFRWVTEDPRNFTKLVKVANDNVRYYTCGYCGGKLTKSNNVTWINTSYDELVNENLRVRMMCNLNKATYGCHHAEFSNTGEGSKIVNYDRYCTSCGKLGWTQYDNKVWGTIQCEHSTRTWFCSKTLVPSPWSYDFPAV